LFADTVNKNASEKNSYPNSNQQLDSTSPTMQQKRIDMVCSISTKQN